MNTSDRVAELLLRQDPPRDPLTGRLLKDLTPRALEAVLQKYPCLRAVAPELPDPNAVPNWTIKSRFNGELVIAPEDARREQARSAALLADPARGHEPTKPAPTYNLFRVCGHESAHAVVAHRLGLDVARVTTHPHDDLLGQVFHGNGSRQDMAIVLLAGREGEIALFGNSGGGDGSDTRHALKMARDESGGDEGKATELMRLWRQVAKQMVYDNLRTISKLAFELHRRREIDWDDITAVIDASQRSEPQPLDDEWQHRIALARARISVREHKAEQEAKRRAEWTRDLMGKTHYRNGIVL